ncbi:hypothetical protein D3C85_632900 [compost metagenome]
MKHRLETRLQTRLSAFLPGHIVKCSIGPDGTVGVAVDCPASGESWLITGITMQSLVGRGALESAVDQMLVEISVARGEVPLLLTRQQVE